MRRPKMDGASDCGRSWIRNGTFKSRRFAPAGTASVTAVGVLVIRGDRYRAHHPVGQLRGEQLVADAALRLQRTAVSTASRASDGPAEQAHRLRCDAQIKSKAASGVMTGGVVNDAALARAVAGFMFGCRSRGLHLQHLPSWGF